VLTKLEHVKYVYQKVFPHVAHILFKCLAKYLGKWRGGEEEGDLSPKLNSTVQIKVLLHSFNKYVILQ